MTPMAVAFMAGSWTVVLGLTFWAFRRVLRASDTRNDEGEPRGERMD